MVNFRKRIQIIPGVKLNLSKGGISTTVGVKGASVNIGRKGTYLNTGIPGTGIYQRKKISGNGSEHESVKSEVYEENIPIQSKMEVSAIPDDILLVDESTLQGKNIVILVKQWSFQPSPP